MASGEDKVTPDKLGSKNYSTLKFKLKHWFIAKELWGIVDGSEQAPESSAEPPVKAQYAKKLIRAMSYIVLAVSDNLTYLITSCNTPKEAWDTLQGNFERNTGK